ncbi:hypothetical protein BGW80DRAFT_1560553 [Lactifluus volemus]|nr:hypothetical protein BGW80DRAFT_1560553 [Lactifluus volemus]
MMTMDFLSMLLTSLPSTSSCDGIIFSSSPIGRDVSTNVLPGPHAHVVQP